MKKILHLLKDNKAFNALLNKQNIVVNSSNSEALLIASAFLTSKKDMLIVKSNQYEANLLYKQVSQMIDEALYFPVDESYRIESLAASGELLGQRLGTMYQLTRPGPHLLISHGHSVMRYVPTVDVFKKNCMTLKVGDHIDVYDLQRFLAQAGYMHTTRVDQPFYFSKRGGVVDIFSMQYDHPIRIDFFDDEIDYINLDGAALWEDDVIETNVLKEIWGKEIGTVSLSCPKSMFGNTFGAAGALDAIINCLAIKNNTVPPTINYEDQDSNCDLNYTPNKALHRNINTVLQIARGRGGINSAMLLREFKE